MIAERFEGDFKISYHLAPPLLSGKGQDGRPKKRQFGAWFDKASRTLAKLKFLRETPFDVFGYTAERRMERFLITEFEVLVERMQLEYDPARHNIWHELMGLPQIVLGFGPVKLANANAMWKRSAELLVELELAAVSKQSAA